MTVGEPGDPATNPTVLWPSDRKEFKAGTLTFTSATLQDGAECKNINYDPLVMSDDISLRPTIPCCCSAPHHLCPVIREAPARPVMPSFVTIPRKQPVGREAAARLPSTDTGKRLKLELRQTILHQAIGQPTRSTPLVLDSVRRQIPDRPSKFFPPIGNLLDVRTIQGA